MMSVHRPSHWHMAVELCSQLAIINPAVGLPESTLAFTACTMQTRSTAVARPVTGSTLPSVAYPEVHAVTVHRQCMCSSPFCEGQRAGIQRFVMRRNC